MTIELIAAALFEDGWAYFKEKEKFYLVRPPYSEGSIEEVEEQIIENAVTKYGFSCACDKNQFNDYGQLFDYLREMIVKTYKDRGRPLPNGKSLRRELRKELFLSGGEKMTEEQLRKIVEDK